MASLFLSYDRDDAAAARVVAQALERAGHDVWWDRQIKGGAEFSKLMEEALERADAVIVLWSREAVDSAWVRDEARSAATRVGWCPQRLTGRCRRWVFASSRPSICPGRRSGEGPSP